MKFNIYNKTTKQPENGVFAENANMLRQLYAMSGEDIEIVGAFNENPNNNLGIATVPDEVKKLAADIPDDGLAIKLPTSTIQQIPAPLTPIPYNPSDVPKQLPPHVPFQSVQQYNTAEIKSIQEKYFTDNGTEYKINNDGSFKKSWVDVDPKLFRVINTENNKEVKLTNKKIQTLDWVKIS